MKLAVIGLGYVGLPLAVEFGKKFTTLGFDVNSKRLNDLRAGRDTTLEVSPEELKSAELLSFSNDLEALRDASVYIVTVPTPILKSKQPDLAPLISASESIGKVLKKNDTVIFESTVYPGATEDECVPVLERVSGLRYNVDFFCGYSPERINPGDKNHRLTTIKKVTSGSNEKTAKFVDDLYSSIITAGTYRASSIKVAEAAKVIENTQRDVNIALINELAIIFNKLEIDTHEVLEAAATKWNFLPFKPGLVGGHCIGVDPYYLTHKAQLVGYNPEIILAGRRLNDQMGAYASGRLIKAMLKRNIQVAGSKVLIMGLSFKENCPDVRNTKIVDIIEELNDFGVQVDCCDPWVDSNEAASTYGIKLLDHPQNGTYDAIILAVGHEEFVQMGGAKIRNLGKDQNVLYDLKSVLLKCDSDLRL